MQTYRLISFLALILSPVYLAVAGFLLGLVGSTFWQLPGILAIIAGFWLLRRVYLHAHPEFNPSNEENLPLILLILGTVLAYATGHALASINWFIPGLFTAVVTLALATLAVLFQQKFLKEGSYRPHETGRYTH